MKLVRDPFVRALLIAILFYSTLVAVWAYGSDSKFQQASRQSNGLHQVR